jgi:hypothetical protein
LSPGNLAAHKFHDGKRFFVPTAMEQDQKTKGIGGELSRPRQPAIKK